MLIFVAVLLDFTTDTFIYLIFITPTTYHARKVRLVLMLVHTQTATEIRDGQQKIDATRLVATRQSPRCPEHVHQKDLPPT